MSNTQNDSGLLATITITIMIIIILDFNYFIVVFSLNDKIGLKTPQNVGIFLLDIEKLNSLVWKFSHSLIAIYLLLNFI